MGFALATTGSSHIILLRLYGEPVNIIYILMDASAAGLFSLSQYRHGQDLNLNLQQVHLHRRKMKRFAYHPRSCMD